MRILFIISDLTYRGSAKQLTLLAKRLPGERFQRRVCVLGKAGPWAEELRSVGVIVDTLNWRWKFDLPAFGRLRHLIRAFQAEVLHVWGQSALRAAALACGLSRSRLIVTRPLPPRKPSMRLRWWDRWLLRRAERVTTMSSNEAERWDRLGVDAGRIVVIPPGVEAEDGLPSAAAEPLPPRTILCIGPLKRRKGFRDAIWVLDILRFLHSDLQLAFVGSGPDRDAIERFARDARVADRVHFLGERSDLPALLAQAELVWAPCHAAGGINAVLEAMVAARPVVASYLPEMAELVASGETGFLVPPSDQAAFARQTRLLLDDAELRRKMGDAGRSRALELFSARAMAQKFADIYEGRVNSS